MTPPASVSRVRLLCILAVLAMAAALVSVGIMSSGVTPAAESAQEMRKVAQHLDSAASLRDILFNYSQQQIYLDEHYRTLTGFALGFLTLALVLVTALAIAVVKLSDKVRRLRAELERERAGH